MPALFQSPPANAGWLSHMPNPNTETNAMSFCIVTLLYNSVANLRCWCRCEVVVVILSIIEVLRHDSPLFLQLTPNADAFNIIHLAVVLLPVPPFWFTTPKGRRERCRCTCAHAICAHYEEGKHESQPVFE